MFLGERGTKMFELLLMKAKELGRAPTFEEVWEDDRLPNPNDYAYYFGSFNEAIKDVNAKLHFKTPGAESKVIKRPVVPVDPKRKAELDKMIESSLAPMRRIKEMQERERERERKKAAGIRASRQLGERMFGKAKVAENNTEIGRVKAAEHETERKGEESVYENAEWRQKEIAARKESVARAHEKRSHLKEDMIEELVQYLREHEKLPDYDEATPEGGYGLHYSLRSYRTVVGEGDWQKVIAIVQDRLETIQIEEMLAEDEAKKAAEAERPAEPEIAVEEPEIVEEPTAEEPETVEEQPEIVETPEEIPEGAPEIVEREDDAMDVNTKVDKKQLIKELVDFSVANGRMPRAMARGDNPSDEGNLPNSLEIYKAEIGAGAWAEVVKAIAANLPEDMYFDTADRTIKQRKLKTPKDDAPAAEPKARKPRAKKTKAEEVPEAQVEESKQPEEVPETVARKTLELPVEPESSEPKVIKIKLEITIRIEGAQCSVEIT